MYRQTNASKRPSHSYKKGAEVLVVSSTSAPLKPPWRDLRKKVYIKNRNKESGNDVFVNQVFVRRPPWAGVAKSCR